MTLSLSAITVFSMKKFVLIYHGYEAANPESAEAWNHWIGRRAASFVEVGSLFGPGREITNYETIEMTLSSNHASEYSIVAADHIDAAEQLLEGCPIVDSVDLYECLAPATNV